MITKEAKADIQELKNKIQDFKNGVIPEERFKSFRLARGVYGQRQPGVQMLRLKLPYGKITPIALKKVAELSERYTNGNLHLTTRQNIQLHYVKLEDSPEIWQQLEEVGVTTKEACGNTVRNVTASPFAGIDPDEPFDVGPYADAVFKYFLRNPICQDMGRKIKIAFSSSKSDSAFTYIHDFGFIPKIQNGTRGFEVLVGGGLGAQAFMAQKAFDFLPADQVIPFIEAGLRVFDRFGERERRHKARLKFLIEPKKGIGLAHFLKLIELERASLANKVFPVDYQSEILESSTANEGAYEFDLSNTEFKTWFETNVFEQKQQGLYALKIRIPLGNIQSKLAIQLAVIAEQWAAPDIRFTLNQGLVFRSVKPENVRDVYEALKTLNLAAPGFDTLADVTACPGTDTCNLGVTNSTAISLEIENLIRSEYPHLVSEALIKIKISGCMNSCGQHMVANIGFHGSSIKNGSKIIPAMQVVLGGGVDPDGKGFIANKVIKLPTKRILQAIRDLLDDFEQNAHEDQYFNAYVREKGKIYFYDLLKYLGDVTTLSDADYQDWGRIDDFVPEIGVGECAGVMLDLVSTILNDAKDRLSSGQAALKDKAWANSIYYAYNTLVIGAKAMLLSEDVQCNTHKSIIDDFQKYFVDTQKIKLSTTFDQIVLQISQKEPEEDFATSFISEAEDFYNQLLALRNANSSDKLVINEFYKA
ncbi:MAG: nitrite reductase [Cyclobacteriaceae bacterium]